MSKHILLSVSIASMFVRKFECFHQILSLLQAAPPFLFDSDEHAAWDSNSQILATIAQFPRAFGVWRSQAERLWCSYPV